jgi:hypothetical protein
MQGMVSAGANPAQNASYGISPISPFKTQIALYNSHPTLMQGLQYLAWGY